MLIGNICFDRVSFSVNTIIVFQCHYLKLASETLCHELCYGMNNYFNARQSLSMHISQLDTGIPVNMLLPPVAGIAGFLIFLSLHQHEHCLYFVPSPIHNTGNASDGMMQLRIIKVISLLSHSYFNSKNVIPVKSFHFN